MQSGRTWLMGQHAQPGTSFGAVSFDSAASLKLTGMDRGFAGAGGLKLMGSRAGEGGLLAASPAPSCAAQFPTDYLLDCEWL